MGSGQWLMAKRASFRSDSFLDNENVPETGCLSIVVLGASGDLAKKKTFPALFNLYSQVSSPNSLFGSYQFLVHTKEKKTVELRACTSS